MTILKEILTSETKDFKFSRLLCEGLLHNALKNMSTFIIEKDDIVYNINDYIIVIVKNGNTIKDDFKIHNSITNKYFNLDPISLVQSVDYDEDKLIEGLLNIIKLL